MQPTRLQTPAESSHSGRDDGRNDPTLADRLAEGSLPLPLALRYATSVASALRDLHYDGRPHGWVNAASIVLTPSGTVLRSVNTSRQATLRGDITSFGALLFELVNGRKCGPDVPLPVVPRTVSRAGLEGLRMAANRLASRCLSDDSLDMQKIATELRVLKVLVRQLPRQDSVAPVPLPVQTQPQPAEERRVEPPAAIEATVRLEDRQDVGAAPKEPLSDDAAASGKICPRCGSAYVYTSKPRGAAEIFLAKIGSPVHRCHRCYHRYFVFLGMHLAKSHTADAVRRQA